MLPNAPFDREQMSVKIANVTTLISKNEKERDGDGRGERDGENAAQQKGNAVNKKEKRSAGRHDHNDRDRPIAFLKINN